MVEPICSPVPTVADAEAGHDQDHLAELLECLADLRVELAKQRLAISETQPDGDPRVRDVVDRLADLEASLGSFSAKATAAHHLAQRARLV
jgi:hypothetical protein